MTFELAPELEQFRRTVRDFAEKEIGPHVADWDKAHHFPVDVVHRMGELGLFGLTSPEEYGGAGEHGSFTSLCIAIEELGRVDQSMGITLQAGVGLGINPILTYGTAEQKERWLPDLVAGRRLGCTALTEAHAGSDFGAIRTQATRTPLGWRIDGEKAWITNAAAADVIVLYAQTDPGSGGRGIACFVVDGRRAGFRRRGPFRTRTVTGSGR